MLNENLKRQYQETGYCVLSNVIGAAAVQILREAADACSHDLNDPGLVTEEDGITVRGLHGTHLRNDSFAKLCRNAVFVTEHVWLIGEAPGADTRAYAERCHGRFCGERVPGTDGTPSSARLWMTWWGRTLFVHLPTRMAVLVGDLPAHDWHHLVTALGHNAADWPQAIYERQRAINNGHSTGMETRELWGIDAMVLHVLSCMSRAPTLPDVGGLRQDAASLANP